MENPLHDILEIQGRTYSRRLSHAEQCGWFAAMKLGVSPKVITLCAEVSQQTAVYLRRAGERVGGQWRYPLVAREYEELGHEAFVHKYVTPGLRDQIRAAVETLRVQQKNPVNLKGYNPRADGYVARRDWGVTTSGKHLITRIECHHDRGGYFWRDLKPFPDKPEILADEAYYHPACQLNGDPSRGPERGLAAKGFPRSQDCFRYLRSVYDPKED